MKRHWLSVLLSLAGLGRAQEEVNLDSLDQAPPPSKAPPSSARPGGAGGSYRPGMQVGDVNVSLFFDGYLEWQKERQASRPSFAFGQQHHSLIARAATSEGIVVFADVVNWQNVFEATVPLRFFTEAVQGMPGLSQGSIRFGRILVPFGDFPAHPLYGGSVENSELLRSEFWSDYGASLKLAFGDAIETELYAVNGVGATGDSTLYLSAASSETNQSKGLGVRIKVHPTPASSVTASYYHDALNGIAPDGSNGSAMALHLGELDASLRTGPLGWKAGYVAGRVLSDAYSDYWMTGWYAESRLSLGEHWALRLRGGQVDPDSRVKNDNDQSDVNLGILWQKGPLDVSLVWYHNLETYALSKNAWGNNERVRLETFVAL